MTAAPLALKMCAGCTRRYAVEGDVGDEQGGCPWFLPALPSAAKIRRRYDQGRWPEKETMMSTLNAGKMSENELDTAVHRLCQDLGLYAYHTYDSRRSSLPGFPDWVIIGPRGVLFRENKSEYGSVSTEQRRIGRLLSQAGQQWGIWRPTDLISGLVRRELLSLVL